MTNSQSCRPGFIGMHAKDYANALSIVSVPHTVAEIGPRASLMYGWPELPTNLKLPGHRVTLTRPRFLRRPLVITTNANPSHADALRDLRYQFKAVTGRPYLPRRGDILSHEVTK